MSSHGKLMIKLSATFFAVSMALIPAQAIAKRGGGYGGSYSPGTGSNPSSHSVQGYVKKDGSYIAPYRQSNQDKSFNNNWTTKGNSNLVTGADGTRITPPKH